MSDVADKLVAADAFANAADNLIAEHETHDTVGMASVVANAGRLEPLLTTCGVDQTSPMLVEVTERLRRAVPQQELLELGSPLSEE